MDMDDMLPSSGEEYLRMVKAQARSCPAVVIASVAQEHLAVKNTSRKYQTDWKSCRPAPEGCAPSAAWQEQFMLEFRVARDNFQRFKQYQESCTRKRGRRRQPATESSDEQSQTNEVGSDIPYHNSVTATRSSSSSIPMVIPSLYDEQGWRRLLYGAQASGSGEDKSAEGIQPDTTAKSGLTESAVESSAAALSEVLEKGSSTVITPRTTGDQANQYQGISPHPRFLMRLNQGHLVQLLKYHLRWLAEDDLTDPEGMWLYALFLKLDPLLESDQVAVLRNLAKKCARIRSHFD
ncbi:gem (nuclear organelle) associated protein 2, partial [Mortierella alpina]